MSLHHLVAATGEVPEAPPAAPTSYKNKSAAARPAAAAAAAKSGRYRTAVHSQPAICAVGPLLAE